MRTIFEVFFTFLGLGLTSFGGPVAHLGYSRRVLVENKRWLGEEELGELIALAQSLPGPSSSQVGFGIGLLRGGWGGGCAAFAGFTLPSAGLMLAFAMGYRWLGGGWGASATHGLQVFAVAVVAQAVVTMRRMLVPNWARGGVAVVGFVAALVLPASVGSLAAIGLGTAAGLAFFRGEPAMQTGGEASGFGMTRGGGLWCGVGFCVLLALSIYGEMRPGVWGVAAAFYRSGALVFGGGHVVLPVLESTVVARGWVSETAFLTGYGAAQALPGPLFSFAAYLGAVVRPTVDALGTGVVAVVAIFAPGLLLMAAALPYWRAVRGNAWGNAALKGANASVVGLLAAALVRPLWPAAIHSGWDGLLAAAAFGLLMSNKVPVWALVAAVTLICVAAGSV